MKNGLLKAAVAFLFAAAMSISTFASQAWALGDFSQTCYSSSISGSTLSSTCYKADGYTPNKSSINLNPYIENVDGVLKWQPDNYIETCRGMDLVSKSDMAGECKTRSQVWQKTGINLDDHIANINGVLTYE
ncbi:MAG: cyanovirin [Oscillatoria sp. SIO1A7]|nr:cyanovirin [Oscillatoria sp. SIO1A7]